MFNTFLTNILNSYLGEIVEDLDLDNIGSGALHGDILLNGVSVSPARLQDRVAYVRRNNAFGADMSVRQTMLFHSFLREPGTHARSRDAKGRVSN